MSRKKKRSPFSVESRKTEIRYITSDPKQMLGKFVARRAFKTWYEDVKDADTGEIIQIERNDVLLERGTYIDNEQLSSINFMLQEGSLKEVEVSNQNRQGILLTSTSLFPFKAAAKIDDKRKTFLLYASSVANALVILVDFIELNFKGGFEITEIKEMDYCVIIIDRLKPAEARKLELDAAYLKGDISMETFVEATIDKINDGNPDVEEEPKNEKEGMKFYEIGAHIVRSHEKEGTQESDHIFIVQTISAVRANMLIEKYLRDKQEEEYLDSLANPDMTYVKYDIRSFIETSKIIPIGCFIPVSFSEVYNENDA